MSERKQEQAGTQQQKPPAKKPAQKKGRQPALALEVRGPVRGRWRAGRRFGPDPVVIPLEELNEAARAAIEADPLLSVREVEVEA